MKKGYIFGIALVVSIILSLLDYNVQNITYPVLDDTESFAKKNYYVTGDDASYFSEDSVVYVNVAYDKQLVSIKDQQFSDTIGQDVITDRHNLCLFLKKLKKTNYRYVFIDIRFEKGFSSPDDKQLFNDIRTMPRLTFSTHRKKDGYEIADSSLLSKASYSDYRSTMFSGFTRYELIQDGHPSVALKIYEDLQHKYIKKSGLLYHEGWRPCFNMVYLPLPFYLVDRKDSIGNGGDTSVYENRYELLGRDYLNTYTDEQLRDLVNNKYVIIGDFNHDIQDTYLGPVPGPILAFAAYQYLEHGLHYVSLRYYVFLTLLYLLIFISILQNWTLLRIIKWAISVVNLFLAKPIRGPKNLSLRIGIKIILSFMSTSLILFIIKMAVFTWLGISMIFFVPLILFWLLDLTLNLKRNV